MESKLTITAKAQQHLRNSLANAPQGTIGLRLGLRDAGCSGFAYVFDFTTEQASNDEVLDINGIKLYIAQEHIKALRGTEIDLQQEGINSVLKFNNPNVINACGCGESFQFKD